MFLWLYQWFNYLPESEVAVAILELFFPTTGGGGVAAHPSPCPHPHTIARTPMLPKDSFFFNGFGIQL